MQSVQLVRLLGSYGNWSGQRMPQKVVDADALSASWPITATAAEILADWPNAFERLLDQLRSRSDPCCSGRMGRAFGGFYSALYRGLRAAEFDFVRRAFENYIARAWTGSIGRRNRRLEASVLDRMEWIPIAAACRVVEISAKRILDAVHAGRLSAERRTSQSGRDFLLVKRSELCALELEESELTLKNAAAVLGLKKHRLSSLMPTLCGDVTKRKTGRGPSRIPREWVARWQCRIAALPSLKEINRKTQVSVDEVLRYWSFDEVGISAFLLKVQRGELKPEGALASLHGLASMVFPVEQMKALLNEHRSDASDRLTIPDVAVRLRIKQEVAYSLVRAELLPSVKEKIGRRVVRLVGCCDVAQFQRQYVFCRDLAGVLGRSPKALVAELAKAGVQPLAGPHVDGCRQILYRATDVRELMSPTRSGSLKDPMSVSIF